MSVINIVFQSNSIDGWFSAYLTSQLAVESEDDLVFFHPIDAKNPDTWPEPEKLVPLSANKAAKQISDKAFCYFIDCTIINSEYLVDICKGFNLIVIDNNPAAGLIDKASMILVKHNPKMTTISQVWQHFGCSEQMLGTSTDSRASTRISLMAHAAMPEWVQQVNRIESWSMEGNDRAIRENLLEICRLPTMGRIPVAIYKTDQYVNSFTNIDAATAFLTEGEEKLKTKIAGFTPLLASTQHVVLPAYECGRWGFPLNWIGRSFLFVDSTGYAPDSSELATCAFERFSAAAAAAHKPDCFINYRRKTHPGSPPIYIYSARVAPTSDLSLVDEGSPFKGFEKSAGALISCVERFIPFVR